MTWSEQVINHLILNHYRNNQNSKTQISMKKAYVLNDTSDKMGTSFLYGNFERQHSMLKKAGLPNDVRSVTDVDMVLIHREMGKNEYY